MNAKNIIGALHRKAGFEAISQNETPTQLRLMGRIVADTAGLNIGNWKVLMFQLLGQMGKRPWKVDLSKPYFIRPETGKLVFAWRIIFEGPELPKHYEDIVTTIFAAKGTSRGEVTEMPLSGVGADRNSTAGGKRGAGGVGQVLVGPLAVAARLRGG